MQNVVPPSRLARLIPLVAYLSLLVILSVKFSYYLTLEPLTGWDTIGHLHLAREYNALFSNFDSTGYDPRWFQGFPIFYFYPPAFYFFVSNLHLLLGHFFPFQLSFNLGILTVILLFSCAYMKLAVLILSRSNGLINTYLLAMAGLLFYLLYPGDGLQGVSTVGVLGGTFVSTFGHALIMLCLYYLEKYRRGGAGMDLARLILLVSLLIYSHYLSTVFLYILLTIYFVLYRRRFRPLVLIAIYAVPVLIAFPVVFLFFRYGHFSSGVSIISYYPGLLSLLGKDIFQALSTGGPIWRTVLNELFVNMKAINVFFIGVFVAGIYLAARRKIEAPLLGFVFCSSAVFFWLAMDTSLAFLMKDLAVHWYRAFDVFLIFFSIACLMILLQLARRLKDGRHRSVFSAGLVCLLLIKLFSWDPVAHEGYNSIRFNDYFPDGDADLDGLQEYLSVVENDALILPELVRSSTRYGSPHWLDFVIQKTGHRNALGLTIESSLTPLLTYAYLLPELKHFFVWGIDASWAADLFRGADPSATGVKSAFPDYVGRSGIDYLITQTLLMRRYLDRFPDYFAQSFSSGNLAVFRVLNPVPKLGVPRRKPYGFVRLDVLRTGPQSGRAMYRDFLLQSNQVRLLSEKQPGVIINLNPFFGQMTPSELKKLVSGLIVFNTGSSLAAPHLLQKLDQAGMPLVLVNFKKGPKWRENREYLYTVGRPDESLIGGLADRIADGPAEMPRAEDGPAAARERPGQGHGADKRAPYCVVIPEVFNGRSIRADIGAAMPPDRAAESLTPVQIGLSFFPDWRDENGRRVFQTDTNKMLVYAESGRISLTFRNPMASIITLFLYLLLLALGGTGVVFAIRKRLKHN